MNKNRTQIIGYSCYTNDIPIVDHNENNHLKNLLNKLNQDKIFGYNQKKTKYMHAGRNKINN